MRMSSRVGGAVAALALTAGMATAVAPQAGAVTAVDFYCESGDSQFHCSAGASGLQGTATVEWYLNGLYIGGGVDQWSTGLQWCLPGHSYTVRVVVTDAVGQKQAAKGMACNSGPWP